VRRQSWRAVESTLLGGGELTMYFTPEQLRTLEDGYYTVSHNYQNLLSLYTSFSNTHPRSSEYILHGFVRRLGTLQRCIQNVYSLYPPDRSDIPPRDTCLDLTINLQSFVFNVFGCLDNLAWIWVAEKQLKTVKGKPLTGNAIGFSRRNIYESFSTEFQRYLDGLNGWFKGMEDYRHALAHRIPLYIPPFVVHPTKRELYNNFENLKNEALGLKDFSRYDELDSQQEKLGNFNPAMMHSYVEGTRPVVFHFQVLADWNTVAEIAEMFLTLQNW
jgi:hypothetical protein